MRQRSDQTQNEFVGLSFVYRLCGDASAPLIVLVHGRAGNGDVMWAFERTLPQHANVVSFEAFLPDPIGGFSWWEASTRSVPEADVVRARDRLDSALQRFQELFDLRPMKLIALGFSQGSVLLSAGVLTGVLRLDGLGVMAGFVSGLGDGALVKGRPEVYIAHGSADEVVSVDRARTGVERLKSAGLSVTYVEEEGVGHKLGIAGMKGLRTWLEQLV